MISNLRLRDLLEDALNDLAHAKAERSAGLDKVTVENKTFRSAEVTRLAREDAGVVVEIPRWILWMSCDD